MRVTLRQLQIFTTIARLGSTASAATKISLSQSATSASLNQLENCLGVKLFDRSGKNLILNDNGRSLYRDACMLLDAAQDVENSFVHRQSGSDADLRIGASTTIGNHILPKILADFNRLERHCVTSLTVVGNTRDVARAVVNFEVDIGFIEGPCPEDQLRVIPWLSDRFVIVCAPAHPLATRYRDSLVPTAELQDCVWILREPGSGTREFVERSLLPHLHDLTRPRITVASSEAIKMAVAEELGIACMSWHVVREMVQSGQLIALNTELPALTRRLYLIAHQKKIFTRNITAFLVACGVQPFWQPGIAGEVRD